MQYNLQNSTISISWTDVFSWPEGEGHLRYIVYLGNRDGSGNLVTGRETEDTHVTYTSPVLLPPIDCFVLVTAVTPSGVHIAHHENIQI